MATKQQASTAPAAAPIALSQLPEHHARLFKGATRVATIKGGVPTRAFVIMVAAVGWVAMFSIYFIALTGVFYPIMALISRNDDRAFWIIELWIRTKLFARNKHFWGAISYSPTPYARRRAWCRNKE